jgi:hypothetical protein
MQVGTAAARAEEGGGCRHARAGIGLGFYPAALLYGRGDKNLTVGIPCEKRSDGR